MIKLSALDQYHAATALLSEVLVLREACREYLDADPEFASGMFSNATRIARFIDNYRDDLLEQLKVTPTGGPKNSEEKKPEHYAGMAIDVIDFCRANDIPFNEGNVIKYVCRWQKKGGIEDLKKARAFLDRLIETAERKSCADDD